MLMKSLLLPSFRDISRFLVRCFLLDVMTGSPSLASVSSTSWRLKGVIVGGEGVATMEAGDGDGVASMGAGEGDGVASMGAGDGDGEASMEACDADGVANIEAGDGDGEASMEACDADGVAKIEAGDGDGEASIEAGDRETSVERASVSSTSRRLKGVTAGGEGVTNVEMDDGVTSMETDDGVRGVETWGTECERPMCWGVCGMVGVVGERLAVEDGDAPTGEVLPLDMTGGASRTFRTPATEIKETAMLISFGDKRSKKRSLTTVTYTAQWCKWGAFHWLKGKIRRSKVLQICKKQYTASTIQKLFPSYLFFRCNPKQNQRIEEMC